MPPSLSPIKLFISVIAIFIFFGSVLFADSYTEVSLILMLIFFILVAIGKAVK